MNLSYFWILYQFCTSLIYMKSVSCNFTYVHKSDTEFTKDITSLVVESTLASKCNSNTFMTSKTCGNYISTAIKSLNNWAPPVIVTSFDANSLGIQPGSGETRRREQWNRFLAWQRKTCSLILICDFSDDFGTIITENSNDSQISPANMSLFSVVFPYETTTARSFRTTSISRNLDFLSLRKFITTFDQILYLYNPRVDDEGIELTGMHSRGNTELLKIHYTLLKHSGILLSIEVENRTLDSESLLRIVSKCNFCGREKQTVKELGNWQRNRTQFSRFFPVFDNYAKITFNGYNLTVGYFNHPPHFSFHIENGSKIYSGVEWQMLLQMAESLDFSFNLVNLTVNTTGLANASHYNNISVMIEALQKEYIDMAVGGISVSPERKSSVDFSKIFSHEPIVFVVAKRQDIYILGIWLAFQPQVWPLIIILIVIISLLFRTILRPPSKDSKNMLLSDHYRFLLMKDRLAKFASISLFRALEITVTPLLGQPLSSSLITKRPRRLIKMLLVIWWFSCLIISTLYNTSLITSLINPVTPEEPESLNDLINLGYTFKLGHKPGVIYELISADVGLNRAIYDNNGIPQESAKLLKQIKNRLIADSDRAHSLVAYVVEESSVDMINWKGSDIGFSQIQVIRERLFLTGYGFALPKSAPYKKKLDTALGRLASSGLIEYWYFNISHKDKEPTDSMFRLRKKLGQIHLDMEILQGAFLFLFLGCGFAFIVFGYEKFTEKYTFRFFTVREVNATRREALGKIMYYMDMVSGENKRKIAFKKNEGNAAVSNKKFKEAAFEIVNIRKSYPFIK